MLGRPNKTSTSQGGFGISNERKRFVEAVRAVPEFRENEIERRSHGARRPVRSFPLLPPSLFLCSAAKYHDNPTTCLHVVHLRVVLGFARSFLNRRQIRPDPLLSLSLYLSASVHHSGP